MQYYLYSLVASLARASHCIQLRKFYFAIIYALVFYILFVVYCRYMNINKSSGFLTVPVAVLIAGLFIGLAVIYAVGRQSNGGPALVKDTLGGSGQAPDQVRPVDADDFVFGDSNATVMVIEYSDPECPFCKRFHETMRQIASEYKGKVAWVHRFFPLDSLHPKARKESEAILTAGVLGGNERFWAYLNRLMDVTPSNNGLDLAELPKIAAYVGLDVDQFTDYLESGKAAARVEADAKNAVAAGGEGTPYSIVIGRDGKKYPIAGALPFASVREIIDQALK